MSIAKSVIRADWEQDSSYEIVMKNGLFVALPNSIPIFVLKGFLADSVICFFSLMMLVWKRDSFFSTLLTHAPCDPSFPLSSITPSFSWDAQRGRSAVTALEVKQHQAIPEGLLLPNPPIENRVADNLHFLVLNFPYYTLSYCLYLHKGGLRSPSSLLHTHCPRVTNKGQRGCSLASLLIFQHQSQASRIHFLLLPVASSLASHHSHYKSEINNPALGYFHIILK